MNKSENINISKVDEMAEGDEDFKAELLQAIYTSIRDLQTKYMEGLSAQDQEALQQARHKIKPTITLFELKKLQSVLLDGKMIVSTQGFGDIGNHENQFIQVTNDIIKDLEQVME